MHLHPKANLQNPPSSFPHTPSTLPVHKADSWIYPPSSQALWLWTRAIFSYASSLLDVWPSDNLSAVGWISVSPWADFLKSLARSTRGLLLKGSSAFAVKCKAWRLELGIYLSSCLSLCMTVLVKWCRFTLLLMCAYSAWYKHIAFFESFWLMSHVPSCIQRPCLLLQVASDIGAFFRLYA
jgi:hypothetical protein